MKPVTKKFSTEEANQIVELYEWLRSKRLSAGQAIKLLNDTKEVICDARHAEANKIML